MPTLSPRDIRRKMRSIRNIQQICRAMRAVAAVRLRRAEERLHGARPYAQTLTEMVSRLAAAGVEHPWLEQRAEASPVGVVVISSDKGLCGSYNVNLIRAAEDLARREDPVSLAALGRKAHDFFARRGYQVRSRLVPLGAEPEWGQVAQVADAIGELYTAGAWNRVVLVHTQFVSAARTRVNISDLLPVSAPPAAEHGVEYIYEPSPQALLAELLPRYLRTRLYLATLEAAASEHASRVIAMAAASDNAQEMLDDLTLSFNKARQALITKELTDIVGAAEALR